MRGTAGLLAPPTRREITLAIFGLCAFVLSYNLDSSLHAAGVDSQTASRLSAKLGLTSVPTTYIGPDGRRVNLEGEPDALELAITGGWDWTSGAVAGGEGRPPTGEGAEYLNRAIFGQELNDTAHGGGAPVNRKDVRDALMGWGVSKLPDEVLDWKDGVAKTRVKQHITGYTVLDDVVLHRGIMYIVTDDTSQVPALTAIASSNKHFDQPPTAADWRVISSSEADEKFGLKAARIHGTSWIATGPSSAQDSHTLLSLWRLHASLDPSITPSGHTTNSPPLRLFFPHIPTYTVKNFEGLPPIVAPARTFTGVDSALVKAMFPTLSIQTEEDWEDYKNMSVPFVFQRLLLADRGAATRAAGSTGAPAWAAPFKGLQVPEAWMAPLRRTLADHLDVDDTDGKKVVTYLSAQSTSGSPKLSQEEHNALVMGLRKISGGVEVHVVDEQTPWEERMRAVVRSSVIVGPSGDLLMSAVLMRPSDRAIIIELFPAGIFKPDIEIPARTIGLKYMAWHNDKGTDQEHLPSASYPADGEWARMNVHVSAKALVKAVQNVL